MAPGEPNDPPEEFDLSWRPPNKSSWLYEELDQLKSYQLAVLTFLKPNERSKEMAQGIWQRRRLQSQLLGIEADEHHSISFNFDTKAPKELSARQLAAVQFIPDLESSEVSFMNLKAEVEFLGRVARARQAPKVTRGTSSQSAALAAVKLPPSSSPKSKPKIKAEPDVASSAVVESVTAPPEPERTPSGPPIQHARQDVSIPRPSASQVAPSVTPSAINSVSRPSQSAASSDARAVSSTALSSAAPAKDPAAGASRAAAAMPATEMRPADIDARYASSSPEQRNHRTARSPVRPSPAEREYAPPRSRQPSGTSGRGAEPGPEQRSRYLSPRRDNARGPPPSRPMYDDYSPPAHDRRASGGNQQIYRSTADRDDRRYNGRYPDDNYDGGRNYRYYDDRQDRDMERRDRERSERYDREQGWRDQRPPPGRTHWRPRTPTPPSLIPRRRRSESAGRRRSLEPRGRSVIRSPSPPPRRRQEHWDSASVDAARQRTPDYGPPLARSAAPASQRSRYPSQSAAPQVSAPSEHPRYSDRGRVLSSTGAASSHHDGTPREASRPVAANAGTSSSTTAEPGPAAHDGVTVPSGPRALVQRAHLNGLTAGPSKPSLSYGQQPSRDNVGAANLASDEAMATDLASVSAVYAYTGANTRTADSAVSPSRLLARAVASAKTMADEDYQNPVTLAHYLCPELSPERVKEVAKDLALARSLVAGVKDYVPARLLLGYHCLFVGHIDDSVTKTEFMHFLTARVTVAQPIAVLFTSLAERFVGLPKVWHEYSSKLALVWYTTEDEVVDAASKHDGRAPVSRKVDRVVAVHFKGNEKFLDDRTIKWTEIMGGHRSAMRRKILTSLQDEHRLRGNVQASRQQRRTGQTNGIPAQPVNGLTPLDQMLSRVQGGTPPLEPNSAAQTSSLFAEKSGKRQRDEQPTQDGGNGSLLDRMQRPLSDRISEPTKRQRVED